MILKKILLAFQPPGLGLVYHENSENTIKHINLINLNENTDINELTNKILENESTEIQNHKNLILSAIEKIQDKLKQKTTFKKCQNALMHFLPITNIAIDNSGEKCVTGSYDHSAVLWNIENGKKLRTLEGHKNVVFSVAFNSKGDKILTGSFDKTAKLWDSYTAQPLQCYWGHTNEIISAQFLASEQTVVTASTDTTLRLFQSETGQEIRTYRGHTKDIVSVQVDKNEKIIASGSFDRTVRIWDAKNSNCVHVLCGHEGEISSCKINDEGTMLVSGSFDGRVIVWDLRMMKFCKVFPTNTHEQQKVLDIDFLPPLIAASSSSGTVFTSSLESAHVIELTGHVGSVSRAQLTDKSGISELITGGQDGTARVWNLQNPGQHSVLAHPADVTAVQFTPSGDGVVTVAGNKCTIWWK